MAKKSTEEQKPKKLNTYTYDECKRFLDSELQLLKAKKKIKKFCLENDISYNTLIMFKNNKLIPKVAERFLPRIFKAFGYKIYTSTSYKLEIKLKLNSLEESEKS